MYVYMYIYIYIYIYIAYRWWGAARPSGAAGPASLGSKSFRLGRNGVIL